MESPERQDRLAAFDVVGMHRAGRKVVGLAELGRGHCPPSVWALEHREDSRHPGRGKRAKDRQGEFLKGSPPRCV